MFPDQPATTGAGPPHSHPATHLDRHWRGVGRSTTVFVNDKTVVDLPTRRAGGFDRLLQPLADRCRLGRRQT